MSKCNWNGAACERVRRCWDNQWSGKKLMDICTANATPGRLHLDLGRAWWARTVNLFQANVALTMVTKSSHSKSYPSPVCVRNGGRLVPGATCCVLNRQ